MTRVTPSEMREIRAMAAAKKAKRSEKAKTLWMPKIKRQKTKSISQMESILWGVCSNYIRLRDKKLNNGLCFYCGVNPIECAMHRIKRGKRATKYDERNLHGGCNSCNFSDGPGNQSQKFDAIFIKKNGAPLFLELESKSREFAPRNKGEIARLTEYFKAVTDALLLTAV